MQGPGHIPPGRHGGAARLRLPGLLMAGWLASCAAGAACIDLPFADLQSLTELDVTNANQAVARAPRASRVARRDRCACRRPLAGCNTASTRMTSPWRP